MRRCESIALINILFSYIGYCSEGHDRDRSMSGDSAGLRFFGRGLNQQSSLDDPSVWMPGINEQTSEDSKSNDEPTLNNDPKPINDPKPNDDSKPSGSKLTNVEIAVHGETPTTPPATSSLLHPSVSTTMVALGSTDNLTANFLLSGPSSPSNHSSVTLVGSTGSVSSPRCYDKDITPTQDGPRAFEYSQAPTSPVPERKRKSVQMETVEVSITNVDAGTEIVSSAPAKNSTSDSSDHESEKPPKKPTDASSTKPKIISAIAKTTSDFLGRRHSKIENVLQPAMDYLTMSRRPSTGTIGIPVAALTQHRLSLQLNTSDVDASKVIHRE